MRKQGSREEEKRALTHMGRDATKRAGQKEDEENEMKKICSSRSKFRGIRYQSLNNFLCHSFLKKNLFFSLSEGKFFCRFLNFEPLRDKMRFFRSHRCMYIHKWQTWLNGRSMTTRVRQFIVQLNRVFKICRSNGGRALGSRIDQWKARRRPTWKIGDKWR